LSKDRDFRVRCDYGFCSRTNKGWRIKIIYKDDSEKILFVTPSEYDSVLKDSLTKSVILLDLGFFE
jgi:hypothetical protein